LLRNPLTREAPPEQPEARVVATALAVGRLALGVAMTTSPRLFLRFQGFKAVTPATETLARLAGGRDLVMGAATLAVRDDREALRTLSLLGAGLDAADAAAFATALAARVGEDRAAITGLAAAVPATLACLWIAGRLERLGRPLRTPKSKSI
jgi:hypothetical protein